MPKRKCLTLKDENRSELVKIRDQHPKSYMREKAAALLKIADGQSAHQVALSGLYKQRDPETVCSWVKRYEKEGINGLQIRSGRGRKPCFSP